MIELKSTYSSRRGLGRLNTNANDAVRTQDSQAHQRHSQAEREPGTRLVSLSFVVPVKDEEATIETLYEKISEECKGWAKFEIILIDDGSRDNSWEVISKLSENHPGQVRGVRFRRNCGKAAALSAGFRAAKGEFVFTMDADLQDDPSEIRRFLAKLDEGYDIVSGYKKVRHDPWHKVLPSRVFNAMLSKVSGVKLHDHNCGFKCYRSEVVKNLTLYGEMHRMVPALSAIKGFRASEIVVQHHPRRHGVSKYGIERFLRGFMDMSTVGFLRRYRERPSHFFGGVSAVTGLLGMTCVLGGLLAALFPATRGLAAATSVLSGVVFLATAIIGVFCGILSELIIRGGLDMDWKLPIVEDTRFASKDDGPATRRTDIPTAYNPGR